MSKKKCLRFTVLSDGSMVVIDSKHNQFNYSNIRGMYRGKTDGHGLQCNDKDGNPKLLTMCDKISDLIYKYLKEE